MPRSPLLLACIALLSGCIKHVTILSDPAGAEIHKGHRNMGTAPLQITMLAVPFLRQPVRVGMAGYRGQEILINRNLRLFRTHSQHDVILIRAHGPSGTWRPEDAGKN